MAEMMYTKYEINNSILFHTRMPSHQMALRSWGKHLLQCIAMMLFIIVMDAVSKYVRHDVPWGMLYADDLILSDISLTNLQKRFGEWQEALESKGLKVNADKTETMVCARTAETL